MQSLLHLKLFLVKENQFGEKKKKHIGGFKKPEFDNSGDEHEYTATHHHHNHHHNHNNNNSSSSAPSSSDPCQNSTTPEKNYSLNRILTLSRSPAFQMIRKRVNKGNTLTKSIFAGSSLEDHVKGRTALECAKFAIKHVRSSIDKAAIETNIFAITDSYDSKQVSERSGGGWGEGVVAIRS